ncbi:MAG: hypothetical protein ACR2P1_29075 [Pseudomonadales bacterium]
MTNLGVEVFLQNSKQGRGKKPDMAKNFSTLQKTSRLLAALNNYICPVFLFFAVTTGEETDLQRFVICSLATSWLARGLFPSCKSKAS